MPLLPTKANTEGNNETLGDRTPIPAGDYLAHIVKTEFKPTKAKTGHRLVCQFKILEGEKKGRVVFVGLNLDNPNPIAVEIATKELNSICSACGLEDVEDSDELLNIPMTISVTVKKGDAQWPASNEVSGYKAAEAGNVVPDFVNDGANTAPTEEGKELPWNQ